MVFPRLLSPSRASTAFRALCTVLKPFKPTSRFLTHDANPVYVPDQLFADEGRWLYNEEQRESLAILWLVLYANASIEWSLRRLKFNPEALIKAAEAVAKDAKCVLLERLAEGSCFMLLSTR